MNIFKGEQKKKKMAVSNSSWMQKDKASAMVLSLQCMHQVTIRVHHFESGAAVMGSKPLAVQAPELSCD